VAPGQPFDKVWRVRNDGDAPLPAGCYLANVGGELLGHTPATKVPLHHNDGGDGGASKGNSQVKQPLEEFDVALPCVAPTAPGKYVSYWRLVAPGGAQFGHRLWIDISVTELESKKGAEEEQQAASTAAAAAAALAMSSNLGKEVVAPPLVPPTKTETVLDVLSGGLGVGAAAAESVESLEADKWEEVEAPAVVSPSAASKKYSSSNPFLGGGDNESDEAAHNVAAAEELSASMEGAALAGSVLNASGQQLTESVAAAVEASKFDEALVKWGTAVTKITEMGFDDVPAVIALLEKHATPQTYEAKLQTIVGELLSGMPGLN